jgi:hypothetical protein
MLLSENDDLVVRRVDPPADFPLKVADNIVNVSAGI